MYHRSSWHAGFGYRLEPWCRVRADIMSTWIALTILKFGSTGERQPMSPIAIWTAVAASSMSSVMRNIASGFGVPALKHIIGTGQTSTVRYGSLSRKPWRRRGDFCLALLMSGLSSQDCLCEKLVEILLREIAIASTNEIIFVKSLVPHEIA